MFRHACKLGFEGIVPKRLAAPYRSGPSRDWGQGQNPDSPAMLQGARGEGNDGGFETSDLIRPVRSRQRLG
jgi:hypothetical protein